MIVRRRTGTTGSWIALAVVVGLLVPIYAYQCSHRDAVYWGAYRDGQRDADRRAHARERLAEKETRQRLEEERHRCADLRVSWGVLLEQASDRYRDQLDHVNNELLECQDQCWHRGGR